LLRANKKEMIKVINFIVCDDDKRIIEKIEQIISKYMMKNEHSYKTHFFRDYNKSFTKIMQEKMSFKIYILDIETPTRSGIDIAREIRETDVDSMIIFLTGHEELGLTILKDDLMFLSFINKFDSSDKRIEEAIGKALKMFHKRNMLKFKDGNNNYTIAMDDILYITRDSLERKCIVKTEKYEIKTYKTLRELEQKLDEKFIRVHRACVVNKNRIISIDRVNKEIKLDTGDKVTMVSNKLLKEVSV